MTAGEAGSSDPTVEAAWAEEVERRLRQIDAGEIEPIPWADVKARLFSAHFAETQPHCTAPQNPAA